MYQVVINDKYYVSDVDRVMYMDGSCQLLEFSAVHLKSHGKFFEGKTQALSIAEQVGGKVIEYVEKKDTQIEMRCNRKPEEYFKQIEGIKKWGMIMNEY